MEETKEPEFICDMIKDGFYEKIVIIGFPYDHGARKAGNRPGCEYGPDSFRRFLKISNIGSIQNPEYDIDIS